MGQSENRSCIQSCFHSIFSCGKLSEKGLEIVSVFTHRCFGSQKCNSFLKLTIAENCRMMKNVISGVMYLTFTNPEPNMLRFVTEERRKGWKFESNLTFSPVGKLRKRHN